MNRISEAMDMLSSCANLSQNDINEFVSCVEIALVDSAKHTFGIYNSNNSSKTNYTNNKTWFNAECKTARGNFHRARRRYSFVKNDETKIARLFSNLDLFRLVFLSVDLYLFSSKRNKNTTKQCNTGRCLSR